VILGGHVSIRFVICLVTFFFLMSDMPATVHGYVLGRVGDGAVLAAQPSKKKKHQKKRRRKKSRKVRAPHPVLPDDPAVPLRTVWQNHLDEFLERSLPIYGAFVAVNPDTGELLALSEYSRTPESGISPATTAAYPAASVFKIVTTAALLEEGKAGPGTVTCYRGGGSRLTKYHLSKPPRRRSRCKNLESAFAGSTNAIFGRLAVERLDADTILEYAEKLGFNHDLELDGLTTRSRARLAENPLDLARTAAGFMNSTLAPLHGAFIGAVIASDGLFPSMVNRDGQAPPLNPGSTRVLSSNTARKIQRMMARTGSSGTAARYFRGIQSRTDGRRVAVKTGTLTSRDGSGRFNTWMVGFYPARSPQFAFAAVLSVKGGGPIKAGHLVRYAVETYHRLKLHRVGKK